MGYSTKKFSIQKDQQVSPEKQSEWPTVENSELDNVIFDRHPRTARFTNSSVGHGTQIGVLDEQIQGYDPDAEYIKISDSTIGPQGCVAMSHIERSKIGAKSDIGATQIKGSQLGESVGTTRSQLEGCTVGDKVFVSDAELKNCEIGTRSRVTGKHEDVKFGAGCRVESEGFIAKGVEVPDNALIDHKAHCTIPPKVQEHGDLFVTFTDNKITVHGPRGAKLTTTPAALAEKKVGTRAQVFDGSYRYYDTDMPKAANPIKRVRMNDAERARDDVARFMRKNRKDLCAFSQEHGLEVAEAKRQRDVVAARAEIDAAREADRAQEGPQQQIQQEVGMER